MLKLTNSKALPALFVAILSVCLGACNQQELVKAVSANSMDGEWLTPCYEENNATKKIYARLDVDKSYVAVLTFSEANCTGSYTMNDSQGNSITEPGIENDVSEQAISGIPDGFHVYKVVNRTNLSEMNIVFYLQGSTFIELISNFAPHSNWNDWLSEVDVAGFAAAPDTYAPSNASMVLTFIKGTLP